MQTTRYKDSVTIVAGPLTFTHNKRARNGTRLYPLGCGYGTPHPFTFSKWTGIGLRIAGHRFQVFKTYWYK